LFPFSSTWRMRHRNGEWRWILCRAITIRDGAGAPARLLAVFTDTTDQVAAEQRQRALATAIPDLMLRVRADGVVLDEKRAASGSMLLSGPVVGQALVDAAGDQPWARRAVAAVRQAIEGGEVVCDECAGPA